MIEDGGREGEMDRKRGGLVDGYGALAVYPELPLPGFGTWQMLRKLSKVESSYSGL